MSAAKPDYAVRDWAAAKPKIRSDLRFHYQDDAGISVYVLEDLVNRSYVQIGVPEYRFLRGLDGTRTAAQLLAESASRPDEKALTEEEVAALLRWLLDQQLLESGDGAQADRRFSHQEERRSGKGGDQNPVYKALFWKIPFGSPDRFLDGANRGLGWLFSGPCFGLWLALVGYGGYLALENSAALLDAGSRAILPSNWLSLALVYTVLKLLHELGHGIAAKRFGAVIPEWGVQVIAFITPLTYVDATASWAFRSRRKRLIVAAAGMYVELAIAALAMIVWKQSGPGAVQTMALNTVFAASVVTLLFNANPLMRFDGYYILSDLAGIRNLGPRSQQLINWMGSRWILGKKEPMPRGTRRQAKALFTYGVLSGIWRVLVMIGLLALMSHLFQGAGLALAVLALVEFPDKAVLRPEIPAFVERVHVRPGQEVKEGQLLATLRNREEESTLEQLRLDLRRSELQSLSYLNADRLASYQAELEVQNGLRERLTVQTRRMQSLQVKAPVPGRLEAANLDSLPGRYLRTGERLFTIYPATPPRLLVSARAEDSENVVPGPIRFRLRGRENELRGEITRVEQRATTAVPHPALAASLGGPLPVREVSQRTQEGAATQAGGPEALSHFRGLKPEFDGLNQELARPRLVAYARIDFPDGADPVHEGEWGYVRLSRERGERLGGWLFRHASQYLRERFEPPAT